MRQRIFLGFASILVLFIGVGLYAVWLFAQIGETLDVIARDNHQRVLAGEAMKESAEQMDSALSSALAGDEEQGRKLFESYAAVFDRFLGRKRASVSLAGEEEVADRIRQAEERYQDLAKKFSNTSDLATRRTILESGQTRQRFEIVSPATLIKSAVPDLKPLVEANDARLVTDVSAELPDVAVDLRQIGHVLSNLVSNAARYSRPGEDVVLSASPIGKSVRFSVLDHGPGIPKEFQSRIFERFFRVPCTEDSTGVGLGLAIAKEMIVSHGGRIGLQSTSGKGSEFYFDLPATSNGVKA